MKSSACTTAFRWVFVLGAVSLLAGTAQAADFDEEFEAGVRPVAEGVPEVAVARLRPLLNESLTGEQRRLVAEKLAEALVAANRPREALTLLEDKRFAQMPAAGFWRAQSFARLQKWNEALPLYEAIAAGPSPLRNEALFGAAETLRALGRRDEALQKLTVLVRDKAWLGRARLRAAEIYLDQKDAMNARRMLEGWQPASSTERKTRRFLLGRLEMVQRNPAQAVRIFRSVLRRPEGVNHSLALATLYAVADAHLEMKTPEAADDFIEDYIEHHPFDPELPAIFAKLDELYRSERKPVRAELERWTHEPEQPRRALAQWYLARIELRGGHRERTLRLFADLRMSRPATPAVAGALLEFAQLELQDRHFENALAILNDARALGPEALVLARINLLAAQAHYRAHQFEAATSAFQQVAQSDSPLAPIALFNASLGWLQLGDQTRFLAAFNELEKEGGDDQSRAQLRLEQGLSQAAKGETSAAGTLEAFAREFPQNPRVSEAWVALAELAFHAQPPRLDEARKDLARAAAANPTAVAAERAQYLMIWIEDASDANDAGVIRLASQFLEQHASSRFAPDVRMKLAETYFRRQDFANAQTQFELLAQQNPGGPLTEKALFFAGESAMSSMGPQSLDRAIVLFDQVVQLKGDLRWAARNEQAIIERKLGKPRDALLLYDEVLKNDAKQSEKREALCGKGDVYFDLAAEDPKAFEQAIEAYEQLANEAGEASHWRHQALFKKGVCLEKKADRNGALTTFYQVLEGQPKAGRPPELFWFYKAGFNAARLLEDEAKWNSAAGIYQKLVMAGGTRADEAKARLNRLRLEHFLWDE